MTVLRYDERYLANELGQMPCFHRAIFSAACAERLLPTYVRFSDRTEAEDIVKLSAILERLWCDLEGQELSAEELQECIDLCMKLIPQESEGQRISDQASAEDAGAAVAYALRCRQNGEAQEAAWAARRVYEALDHFVIKHERIDTSTLDGEDQVLSHPAVQAELMRQHRDVEELIAAPETAMADLVVRIRQRAKDESESLFQPRS